MSAIGLILAAAGFFLGEYSESHRSPRALAPLPAPAKLTASQQAAPGSIRALIREPDAFVRAVGLASELPKLGPDAVPEVRDVLAHEMLGMGAAEVTLLVRFWALHDPAAATRWSFRHAPIAYRGAVISPSIELWAYRDPKAALEEILLMAAAKGPNIAAAEKALVKGWFKSGKPGLTDYIRDLGPSLARQRALAVFAREFIRHDGPQAVMSWAERIPAEPKRFKLGAYRQVGRELAREDFPSAKAWCETHCEGPFGADVRGLIANLRARQDGPSTMQWVANAPAGVERDRAAERAFEGWMRADHEGLEQWMSEMGPDGVEPWFRPALRHYAMWVSTEDPEKAIRWLEQAEDGVQKASAYVYVGQQWLRLDEKAAEAWLLNSPLSEKMRAKVREPGPLRRSKQKAPVAAPQ